MLRAGEFVVDFRQRCRSFSRCNSSSICNMLQEALQCELQTYDR